MTSPPPSNFSGGAGPLFDSTIFLKLFHEDIYPVGDDNAACDASLLEGIVGNPFTVRGQEIEESIPVGLHYLWRWIHEAHFYYRW